MLWDSNLYFSQAGKEQRQQYVTLINELGDLALQTDAGIKVSVNGNGGGAYQGPVQKNMGMYDGI